MLLYPALLATPAAQFTVSHRARSAICRCSIFIHLLGYTIFLEYTCLETLYLDTQFSWITHFPSTFMDPHSVILILCTSSCCHKVAPSFLIS